MPHMQVRSNPSASPRDIDGVLEIVARRGVSLLGVAGSDHEFDGEIGLMVPDDRIAEVADAVRAEYPLTRTVGEPDGLHLDYAHHRTGGLAAAVLRARRHHRRGVVRDIAIGVEAMPFRIDEREEVVRDGDGYPTLDGDGTLIEAHPVQVYFLVTPKRDHGGRVAGEASDAAS